MGDTNPQSSGHATEVDITSLESAVGVLRDLREYVNHSLVGDSATKLKLQPHAGVDSANPTTLIFGGFPAAGDLARKHNDFFTAVSGAYSALVETLDDTIDGTRRIIDNYKTVEDRNRAAAADIARLFSGDAPAPSASSGAAAPAAGASTRSDEENDGSASGAY